MFYDIRQTNIHIDDVGTFDCAEASPLSFDLTLGHESSLLFKLILQLDYRFKEKEVPRSVR